MRALLSVADRDGIAELARDLLDQDIEVYATDGTRAVLTEAGLDAHAVAELTDLPGLIAGQVKTFHPEIYAGILARRHVEADMTDLLAHGIGAIDIVVVNIRPFAPQVGRRVVALDEAVEMIGAADPRPIEEDCACPTCRQYSRAYLRHLFLAGEMLYGTLATVHNLFVYLDRMRAIRQAILNGAFPSYLALLRSMKETDA